jgi:FkbM family methyltransferase
MNQTLAWLIDRMIIKRPRLRRAITYLLEGNTDQKIELLGTALTINTIKEHGYLRAFRMCKSSSLLRDELSVLVNLAFLLSEKDTFVDVGANVGIYALTVCRLKRLFPELRVYAFEANPDTFSRLRKSAGPELIAHQLALSDRSGVLEFVEGAVSHTFTTVDHASCHNIPGRKISVPARRLDECDIQGNSLVIKIDVEGQEMNVLLGATELFKAKRVKATYLDGYENRNVENFLTEHGFHLFEGRSLTPTKQQVYSLLAIHPDKQPGLVTCSN